MGSSDRIVALLCTNLLLLHYTTVTALVTRYQLGPGGKLAKCGYYTLDVRMWAGSEAVWLYVTEKDCNEQTATPCSPSTSPVFAPISCLARLSCERHIGTPPPGVPFCLVLANTNLTAPVDVDLDLSGSLVPVASSSGSGGGLGGTEIALICLGAGSGLFMWAGLMTLWAWLRRPRGGRRGAPRRPQSSQVAPEAPPQPHRPQQPSDMAGPPKLPTSAASASMPVPVAAGDRPQVVYGTITLLPPPPTGTAQGAGAAGPMPVIAPPGVQQGAPRSPPALAPLPPEAYGLLSRPPQAAPGYMPVAT